MYRIELCRGIQFHARRNAEIPAYNPTASQYSIANAEASLKAVKDENFMSCDNARNA